MAKRFSTKKSLNKVSFGKNSDSNSNMFGSSRSSADARSGMSPTFKKNQNLGALMQMDLAGEDEPGSADSVEEESNLNMMHVSPPLPESRPDFSADQNLLQVHSRGFKTIKEPKPTKNFPDLRKFDTFCMRNQPSQLRAETIKFFQEQANLKITHKQTFTNVHENPKTTRPKQSKSEIKPEWQFALHTMALLYFLNDFEIGLKITEAAVKLNLTKSGFLFKANSHRMRALFLEQKVKHQQMVQVG